MQSTTLRTFLLYLAAISLALPVAAQSPDTPPKREFRAVWIATIKNLDWPSQPGLPTEQQKEEFIKLLDFHLQNGINAVVVQIRPSSDAFYFSPTEPWSEWLTGQQGRAPEPWYDPLTFMVEETHKRGMEFHAWFNPYRALVDVDRNKLLSINHVSVERPDWLLRYGRNLYYDPGIPKARDYVIDVIMDVVKRYDIDGIHFDDYFYPYRIAGEEFPDTASYAQYGRQFRSRDEWRRDNVNTFIQMVSTRLRATKPHVKFGVSPFGVWRNQSQDPLGSDTRAGQTSYDDLYADIRLWLARGWIDYVAPQVYFSIGYAPAAYDILLDWWRGNSFGRHLYIGKATYKINDPGQSDTNWRLPDQMPKQILLDRSAPEVKGSIFFRAGSFDSNPLGVNDSLRNHLYRYPALVPDMPWMPGITPIPPSRLESAIQNKGVVLSWNEGNPELPASYYLIYRYPGNVVGSTRDPRYIIGKVRYPFKYFVDTSIREKGKYIYTITALNRLHQESSALSTTTVKVKRKHLRNWDIFIR
jgi:uncharacterized lipoprotein YddW (UPF0748 family)